LRIYIFVPLAYVASVKPGQDVDVLATEYPHRVFKEKGHSGRFWSCGGEAEQVVL
jgi:hypothetical protein